MIWDLDRNDPLGEESYTVLDLPPQEGIDENGNPTGSQYDEAGNLIDGSEECE